MREFKFRAWSNKGKSFHYFDILDTHRFDVYDIQQYTGLKDKEGKEIYEGDIVFIIDDETISSGWFENVIFHRSCFMAGDDNLLNNVHFRCKIIGNKYEGTKSF